VPELGLLGTVRGALRNERPYREHFRFEPKNRVVLRIQAEMIASQKRGAF
jgi:hypothetical protein